ncbi:MAG: guanylate kinase [Rhodothermales bacterium]
MSQPRIIVLTAPSGSGKTSIARRLLDEVSELRFSVSATTREPRQTEENDVDYRFVSRSEFEEFIRSRQLVEYEEVYPGLYYGTLRSEIDRATPREPVLLDVDVQGALSVKERFGDDAFVIFVRPPSLDALEERLRGRGTENDRTLQQRLDRARKEMQFEDRFDFVVVNEDLETATRETIDAVRRFLASKPVSSNDASSTH